VSGTFWTMGFARPKFRAPHVPHRSQEN